ncbi:hypothetical protein B0H11DRAFT_128527 [Mycena galericulata]|nr:hypothetical protein B0H11DRAFT_128527 [Mycena galericulata]
MLLLSTANHFPDAQPWTHRLVVESRPPARPPVLHQTQDPAAITPFSRSGPLATSCLPPPSSPDTAVLFSLLLYIGPGKSCSLKDSFHLPILKTPPARGSCDPQPTSTSSMPADPQHSGWWRTAEPPERAVGNLPWYVHCSAFFYLVLWPCPSLSLLPPFLSFPPAVLLVCIPRLAQCAAELSTTTGRALERLAKPSPELHALRACSATGCSLLVSLTPATRPFCRQSRVFRRRDVPGRSSRSSSAPPPPGSFLNNIFCTSPPTNPSPSLRSVSPPRKTHGSYSGNRALLTLSLL